LAAAVAVDGHNWMYPVAYDFIASETKNNWTWFMEQLKKAIGDPPLAVCSDACKGLETAMKTVFPYAEQRECFYHMANIFKRHIEGLARYILQRGLTERIYSMRILQKWQVNHQKQWNG
jgi:transposase-like protein